MSPEGSRVYHKKRKRKSKKRTPLATSAREETPREKKADAREAWETYKKPTMSFRNSMETFSQNKEYSRNLLRLPTGAEAKSHPHTSKKARLLLLLLPDGRSATPTTTDILHRLRRRPHHLRRPLPAKTGLRLAGWVGTVGDGEHGRAAKVQAGTFLHFGGGRGGRR